jgi:predicted ArsR family transcriptional regulator
MNLAAADSIARSLARLGQLTHRSVPGTDTSREQILRIVQESSGPLSVEDISGVTGLHVNTVRTHLEVLRAGGTIERSRGNPGGRGRPKWLYSAIAPEGPYHRLATDLREALAAAQDPRVAAEAARRWRSAEGTGHGPTDSPDEAVDAAAHALAQLGFDVDVSPTGDALYLGQCPYAALVTEHPVICDIHAQALEQVLAGTGQDVALESMDVFPRPGVCVAHLRRRDVVPTRVIRGGHEASAGSRDEESGGAPAKARRKR